MNDFEKIKDFISNSNDLPSFPDLIVELNARLATNKYNIKELADLIENDISITSHILKLANSPLFRAEKEITRIQDAIVRIGISEVKKITYAASLFPLFSNIENMDATHFWKHSIMVAYIAEIFAELIAPDLDLDEIHICGLLHDMGIMILGEFFPTELTGILKNLFPDGRNINIGFLDIFNSMHAETGALLLKRWNLPDKIVATVQFHHHPQLGPEEFRKMTKIIQMANTFANTSDFSMFQNFPSEQYPSNLKLDDRKRRAILNKLENKIAEINVLLTSAT